MKSGRLIWKERVEKLYGPITPEKDELVSFSARVLVKGLGSPTIVQVYAYLFEGKFLQLWDYKIQYASASLGEKRMEALCGALKEMFYENETLFAPIEQKDGFVFGHHYAFEPHYYTRPVVVLKKKDRTSFEQLVKETVRVPEKESEIEISYFYEKDDNILLQHQTSNGWDEKWKSGKQQEVLYDLSSRAYTTSTMVLDETGRIYQSTLISHPEKIRLFSLKRKTEDYGITSVHGLNHKTQTYTYREILEEKALYEDKPVSEVSKTLPFSVGTLTIFSPRVIGDILSDYPVGSWVKTSEETFGVTTSPREGQSYEVCLEHEYLPHTREFMHDELTKISNPSTIMKSPRLAKFAFEIPRHTYRGFGLVMEERPSVFKVKPLSKYEKQASHLIQLETVLDLRYHRRRQEQAYALMREIHGEDVDFLLMPKEQVTLLEPTEEDNVRQFLEHSHRSVEQEVFENLLALHKVHKINWDILLYHLLSYTAFESTTNLINKLTQLMLVDTDELFLEACFKWFEKMDIKKRIFSIS